MTIHPTMIYALFFLGGIWAFASAFAEMVAP